jgi:hypothetical protein
MGRTYGMNGGESKIHAGFDGERWRNEYWEEFGLGGRVISKWVLQK